MDKTIYLLDNGLIHFSGDDVYGDYTISEIDEIFFDLFSQFLEARKEYMDNSSHFDLSGATFARIK